MGAGAAAPGFQVLWEQATLACAWQLCPYSLGIFLLRLLLPVWQLFMSALTNSKHRACIEKKIGKIILF